MADAELGSAFPRPPVHFRLFSDHNLNELAQASAKGSPISGNLEYLKPPLPPRDGGSYNVFGEFWPIPETLPSLKDMEIQQLYVEDQASEGHAPGPQTIMNMKSLSRQLLLNYLELVGVMGINPEKFPEKIEHLRILFINIHHLLNEYRPHQARETLALLMEDFLSKSRAQIENARRACADTQETLQELSSREDPKDLSPVSFDSLETNPTCEFAQKQKDLEVWKQLENIEKDLENIEKDL
ncbi:Mediator of RNA polymerase II transcription subunit 7 [Neolecta irregularis DAH-3]|uniref:Mediator of RNA polymerase II transcription subunit 7 n=1 Tax=Neolecta irregularis (strain DAH-3) TaxID=1198029 RepID=A0A1U7LU50_NEOID|nr:Mediator of RNA polymerase II transcription subunit 7 [Neolecta irregularis DAH-3]|eukprot:OLL26200.1 Mediator of RNA polymerase II transcription subunit 7 [Neolecta irregularis DAH-3]